MKGKTYFYVLMGMVATCLAPVAAYAASTVSNGVYEVRVQESADLFSFGSWMAFTGAGHPTGLGNDLMFSETGGATNQTTNFSSLRIFGGGGPTDYTFAGFGSGTNLDPFFTSEGDTPMAGTFAGIVDGHRTVWDVTPESIRITQDVVITGTTFADSAIYHTVELTNTGSAATSIGWRNLYDWQVDDPGTDDGPSNQVELSNGTPVVAQTDVEFSHTPGANELVRVKVFPGTSTYEPLLALGFDPGFLPSVPLTIPDEYAYVSWPGSVGTAFDYTPSGLVVGSGAIDDSAGLSWFGRDAARALELAPSGSVRLTQIIVGVPTEALPPGVIPEPSTVSLMALGLAGLAGWRRKQRHTTNTS